ncbi:unnamed protein product [Dicrocoelium dendriticum]|nr:unnamed protein product [Dicrocoelium dendriticum]
MAFWKKSPREQTRSNNREIRSAKRDMTREQNELAREEKRLETEIKRLASKGDKQGCVALAKQLVNIRNQRTRAAVLDSKLSTVSSQQRVAAASATMTKTISSATGIMKQMNKNTPVSDLSNTLQQFNKAQMEADMREEMLNEAMDDVGFEDEADDVVQKVLDELHIDTKTRLNDVPVPPSSSSVNETEDLASLHAQLAKLRD